MTACRRAIWVCAIPRHGVRSSAASPYHVASRPARTSVQSVTRGVAGASSKTGGSSIPPGCCCRCGDPAGHGRDDASRGAAGCVWALARCCTSRARPRVAHTYRGSMQHRGAPRMYRRLTGGVAALMTRLQGYRSLALGFTDVAGCRDPGECNPLPSGEVASPRKRFGRVHSRSRSLHALSHG